MIETLAESPDLIAMLLFVALGFAALATLITVALIWWAGRGGEDYFRN